MKTLEIYLKSGHTIKVICEEWTFKSHRLTGEIVGYEIEGMKEPKNMDIAPDQIAGYIAY